MIKNPFNADFHIGNRQKLLESLPDDAVVVIAAHRKMQEASDTELPFRQESNFQYLTGIDEPDWKLVIDKPRATSFLVAPQYNPVHIAFDGQLDTGLAVSISGVDKVISTKQYARWLKSARLSKRSVYTLLPQARMARYMHLTLNPSARLLIRHLRMHGATPLDCRLQLSKQRAIKQPPEIKAIQEAVDITNTALARVIENRHQYTREYEIEADLMHVFLKSGAEGPAWKPIVAAGKNTCVMHHRNNRGIIKKNDWILMDVGARVHGYVSDVARTIPVGKPQQWQIELFEAVREYHDEVMVLLKPGVEVSAYVQQADKILEAKLKRLGLMKRKSIKEMRRRMPHAIGHGLGIDAHDSLGRFERFQENMVMTVEPGMYAFERDFGVRLENDVIITKDGAKNMSASLPISFLN